MSVPPLTLAAIHQPAFLYGTDGRIAEANDLAEALAGRPLAGCSPAAMVAIFDIRLPDGTPLVSEDLPAIRVLAGEEAGDILFTVTASDGRTVHVLATAFPLQEGGRIAGALSIWHDATGREQLRGRLAESEAKYRNVVDLAPDAILIHQDGAIVFANPAAVAMLGAGGSENLIGRPILDLVHPRTRGNVEWNIEADLRGEESPITVAELIRPDGSTLTVQGRGAMIPFEGRPAVQVVLRDVTEEKRAEQALQASEERLRLAMTANSSFLLVLRFGLATTLHCTPSQCSTKDFT
jgi:PAS domain S-box-containing protein